MRIHEYQAKELLKRYGVAIPRGEAITTPDAARAVAEKLGGRVVVKAQIHAGGRGKAGGIRLADSPERAYELAREMLGMTLVTPQTGPQGRVVRTLLIEEALPIRRELYLGVILDRAARCPVFMASPAGGMDIEEIAQRSPELIFKEHAHPTLGLQPYQARRLAFALGFTAEQLGPAVRFILGLYRAFVELDASLVEVNPLVVTEDGRLYALDAKVTFDDNALFRHPEYAELRDVNEEEPLEVEASRYDLNYIKLNGTIGCMVNGAGLAMATMDIIKLAGGEPANFLDVGGSATTERVENGFRILLSDPNVRAVLINIFGGIVRCDIVAEGVLQAAQKIGVTVPIVVRLEGTNVERARELLAHSGLAITVAHSMSEAAELAVALARQA
ncbi:MAG: ADP-forming succinate--CoA ligase subunit beta [Blastocatellia bacterium]|nr:ADP-forming succinate--CoA ligase subunit beta [Blastocatellia bacterium]MCS7157772.1 ADP-forming succinate--CoA ligase subunit beta [Blastocatellia bacterium]MCX7753285.1 ADP-forming succinate--CoA ligase subunit beta [Blastocatellia bacterium]MDW8168152.1 ADP-forming succinate--CoA ligase subunit beta [Acidobacteriota bacterium]MDW8257600.1 ADP-forming succinate--CoA ligase subunit beta [Acidobacteriota bacterium]